MANIRAAARRLFLRSPEARQLELSKQTLAESKKQTRFVRAALLLTFLATAITGAGVIATTFSTRNNDSRFADPDAELEIVEVRFGDSPISIEQLDNSDVDEFYVDFGPKSSLPLLVILRNSTDSPAVLTEIVIEVEATYSLPWCGDEAGGPVAPSYLYDVRVPVESGWAGTISVAQTFEVEPQDVDALAVTVGMEETDLLTPAVLVQYSVYGTTSDAGAVLWARVLDADTPILDDASLSRWVDRFTYGDSWQSPTGPEAVSQCSEQALSELTSFVADVRDDDPSLTVHPSVSRLSDLYERAAAANSTS